VSRGIILCMLQKGSRCSMLFQQLLLGEVHFKPE
jgi:hypothetical protein